METRADQYTLTLPVGRFYVEYQIRRRRVPSVFSRQIVFMADRLDGVEPFAGRSLKALMNGFLGVSLNYRIIEQIFDEMFRSPSPLFTVERSFSWEQTPLRELRLTAGGEELLANGFLTEEPEREEAVLDYDFLGQTAVFVRENAEFHSETPNPALSAQWTRMFPEMPLRNVLLREKKGCQIDGLKPLKPAVLRGRKIGLQILRFPPCRFEIQTDDFGVQNYFNSMDLESIETILSKEIPQ